VVLRSHPAFLVLIDQRNCLDQLGLDQAFTGWVGYPTASRKYLTKIGLESMGIEGRNPMKSYKVTNLFTTLWGLVGLWILLGGLFFSLQIGRRVFGGIFFTAATFLIIYLLISGKARRKQEYAAAELIQRGILMLLILTISGVMAYFLGSMRPYLIVHMAGVVVLLSLMGFRLFKAEKKEG
jgi:heme A synthase